MGGHWTPFYPACIENFVCHLASNGYCRTDQDYAGKLLAGRRFFDPRRCLEIALRFA